MNPVDFYMLGLSVMVWTIRMSPLMMLAGGML
jgi:hypothetical protein